MPETDDNEDTNRSLIASLRDTITKPVVPLIETIQNVVSSLQSNTDHEEKSSSLASSTQVDIEHEDPKVPVEEEEVTK